MLKLILLLILPLMLTACHREWEEHGKRQGHAARHIGAYVDFNRPQGAFMWPTQKNIKDIQLPPEVTKYFAAGYLPLDTAIGDFNLDHMNDLLIVTHLSGEDTLPYSPIPVKRAFLLFAGQKDGSYQLVTSNPNAIPCYSCCGMTDPFGGIMMNNGELIIIRYCGSNCKSIDQYIFRLDKIKNQLLLNRKINESYCFDYRDYERDTTNYTGSKKQRIENFDLLKEYE